MAARDTGSGFDLRDSCSHCRLRRQRRRRLDLTLRSSGSRGMKNSAEGVTEVVTVVSPGYARHREEFRGNNGGAIRLVPWTFRGLERRRR